MSRTTTAARRTLICLAAASLAAGAAFGATRVIQHRGHDAAGPQAGGAVHVETDDRLPSTTASDWVTYADYVVVATARAETEVPPAAIELHRGEGVIGRVLDMRVDQVLWSSAAAPVAAPSSFPWQAFGWTFHGDPSQRTPMVPGDQPRFEVGHTYVMALDWTPGSCDADAVPAAWRGLGAKSNVPFDGGVIGVGEVAGKAVTKAEAISQADPSEPNYGLADQLAGQDGQSLAAALAAAPTEKVRDYGQLSSARCSQG